MMKPYAAPPEVLGEALMLLDLINAEWQSDPMSVQCFDERIIQRTQALLAHPMVAMLLAAGAQVRRARDDRE